MTTPMRATIIPADSFCSVNGVGFIGVDMTSLSADVHALQWYGTFGEVEIQDPVSGKMAGNTKITDLNDYHAVFNSYCCVQSSRPGKWSMTR
jgi:hypothetical protein